MLADQERKLAEQQNQKQRQAERARNAKAAREQRMAERAKAEEHSRKQREEQAHESITGATRQCPFCAEDILRDAKKCKHCGEFLSVQAPANMTSCPDCGAIHSRTATSCPRCGRSTVLPSRMTAMILAWTLGGVGAHKFYLGQTGQGWLYVLLSPTLLPAIAALTEGFSYLAMSDQKFAERFGSASK